MTSTARDSDPWAVLHEATLVDLQLDWVTGSMRMALRPCGTIGSSLSIVATNVRSLQCPRRFPWGQSVSINEMRAPFETNEGSQIEMQMQSGDLIVVLAEAFELEQHETN